MSKLKNRQGEEWTIEEQESGRLTTIGGILQTFANRGMVALSKRLSSEDKDRGRSQLLDRLTDLPVGTSSVETWHP